MAADDQNRIRWVQRLDNYARAFVRLREAVDRLETETLEDLQKEGIIQRFEYTWELAWRTLKDYLVFKKVTLERVTPADVIRVAFAANIITDAADWMDALDARNKMSHVYNEQAYEEVIRDIQSRYFKLFDDLYDMFIEERVTITND
jgi:nucleotidyltransferase substrate binding protein (TIGR01987 family)